MSEPAARVPLRATAPLAGRLSTGKPAPVPRAAAPYPAEPRPAPARPGDKPVARKRRRGFRWGRWLIILLVWSALAAAGTLAWFSRDLPRPESALDATRRPSLTLQDSAGHTLAVFGDLVGEPMRLSDLPPYVPAAAVAVEDHRYWEHGGLDLIGIARAILVNLTSGRLRQGGSTITQQVAKNLFLTNARTFKRKVQEFLLTQWLEQSFTKREILEIWLNRVYFGSGAWGIDAAARTYFGISARNLAPWQAAVLAGIPRAPSRFNPRHDPQAAAARGREVLAAMAANGVLTQAEAQRAAAAMVFRPPPSASGWFADWAAERAEQVLPQGADAVVRATLDSRLQDVVQRQVQAVLDGPGRAAGVGQAAVVVMDAQSGAVRAMVGGRQYAESGFNRAVAAQRQPGSAFKPFVYLAALEHGVRPDDMISAAPLRIGKWQPQNFEHKLLGDISVEDALADSVNTAAVRLLIAEGGPRVAAEVAHRFGITEELPNDASLALGTGTLSLIDLTAAYAPFFNGGHSVQPLALAGITADGKPVPLPDAKMWQVVDPVYANMMIRMMTAVVTRGSGRAAAVEGRLVAGKTGTTQDSRDAWFIGWTGGTLIGVWMGNDDNTPMHNVTGGSLPARLFHAIAVEMPQGGVGSG